MKQRNNGIEFEVNEVLHFETGQEIDEMLSISLDPDIAIQSYDEYIQIRGMVLLQGEYKRAKHTSNISLLPKENHSMKIIEKVYEVDEERTKFSHRIPVEISVPTHLVKNLGDITVSVDAFDYELPEQNKLNIQASIHIEGINRETSDEHRNNDENRRKEDELLNKKSNDVDNFDLEQQEELVDDQVTSLENIDRREQVGDEQEALRNTDEKSNIANESTEQIEGIEVNQSSAEVSEIDIQLNESSTDSENENVRDVRFLTDLFGGDEEESSTKMRIYIIQEEDSIESIAKKYKVSSLQIMKDNSLTGETLVPGQLLYLPVTKKEHEDAKS